jgi:hypothetical protein
VSQGTLGIAIAKRTGERRILTVDDYLKLDAWSEARWEFFPLRLDPATGEPDLRQLRYWGWTGTLDERVQRGDLREVEPGRFVRWEGAPGQDGQSAVPST